MAEDVPLELEEMDINQMKQEFRREFPAGNVYGQPSRHRRQLQTISRVALRQVQAAEALGDSAEVAAWQEAHAAMERVITYHSTSYEVLVRTPDDVAELSRN